MGTARMFERGLCRNAGALNEDECVDVGGGLRLRVYGHDLPILCVSGARVTHSSPCLQAIHLKSEQRSPSVVISRSPFSLRDDSSRWMSGGWKGGLFAGLMRTCPSPYAGM